MEETFKMAIIKIIPMPGPTGPAGSGSGLSSTVPFNLNDVDNNLLLSITKTGTGTTRIETPQDDLSLRSAADITLFAGSDGPGNVYIGWGDAVYTPDSPNRVATIGDVNNIAGLNSVKYVNWQYPTEGAIAIQNKIDREAISLKSSNSAALRWHVRDGGQSVAGWSIHATGIAQQTGEMGVGPYQAQFIIDELDFIPPTGYHYNVSANGSPWDGSYLCTASTNTTITLEYPGPDIPGANEEFTGGNINPPSIYNQVEVREDGAWIKNANWSEPGGQINYWHFGTDGVFYGPAMGGLKVTGLFAAENNDLYIGAYSEGNKIVLQGEYGEFLNDSSNPNNQIATIGDIPKAHGSFYDVNTFGPYSANSVQTFPMESTDFAHNVHIGGINSSEIVMDVSGKFNIAFSAQFHQTNGSGVVNIWLRKNGADVAWSNTKLDINASSPYTVAAWNFFVDAAQYDAYEICWSSSSNHTILESVAAGDYPGVPSVIVTVNQIA
jgi:hypothetical protein